MSRVSCIRSSVVAALVIALSVFANTGADAEASSAVDKIRSLYAEFHAFKNEDEFRRVGYGRCCKYYQWMKKVEALRGNDVGRVFPVVRDTSWRTDFPRDGVLPRSR